MTPAYDKGMIEQLGLKRGFRRFLKEDGPTAVEYALMLAVIVIAAVGAISALGTSVSDVFRGIGENMGG